MSTIDPLAQKIISKSSFAHLSNVYRYTEQYGIMGHQIGRKIGDMLEVVTFACLVQDEETRNRIKVEPKVLGFTDAAHKVEFGFYHRTNKTECIGLVECKKVGVEVTKHSKTKLAPISLPIGEKHKHTMRPDWVAKPQPVILENLGNAKLQISVGDELHKFEIASKNKIKLIITEDGTYSALGPATHLATITKNIGTCHIFTVENIGDEEIALSIDNCLTGPQTIEKAKQIAWVALDVRRKECNRWGKEDLEEAERKFKAVLVIGEASHWENKSRQVIRAALDHNLIVQDAILVELFELFIAKFGIEGFETMISKARYVKDSNVQAIVDEVVSAKRGRVLTDLDNGMAQRIIVRDDKVVVESVA